VTRAGEQIGTQPACDQRRARPAAPALGDELLVREGQRFVLTPLASLLDPSEVALPYVEQTLAARPVSMPQALLMSSW
jgi:hypothetical protein